MVVWNDVAFVAETEFERQKVVDLKKRIRASGLPVRENYSSPEAVAQMVLRDLTDAIERFFIQHTFPSLNTLTDNTTPIRDSQSSN